MSPARSRRLRFRLLTAFTVGGLLLAASLAGVTYVLARGYLLDQKERLALSQSRANARLVRSMLRAPDPDIPSLLRSLDTSGASRSAILSNGEWFASAAGIGPETVPADVVSIVVDERVPATKLVELRGQATFVAGFPLSNGDAYFEVFPLVELERTLSALQLSLTLAGVTTVVGSAALAVWASRRVLRPIAEVGSTASAIAAGALDARLDVGGDEELEQLERSFNAMVAGLQARIERDARFASDVSHELRSPLTTLKSAVQVMTARRDVLDERSRRALDRLTSEVARFDRLVLDLLEISKMDAGVAQVELAEVAVDELVHHAVSAAGSAGLPAIEGRAGVTVRADKRRLERVLTNLLENAAVHGGGADRVVVSTLDGCVRISVQDRGSGVADEDAKRVFERFYRGRTAGRRGSGGGVGLGLALVAEQVKLHGGRVWLERREGGGTCAVVELPVAR